MTPAERMLELSSLPTGNTPALHFLSITQGTGTGSFIASELEIEMAELSIELTEEITVELNDEVSIEIEEEISVEVC